MTNRKNNNSILFLTTLGVYLGLVLVGATPVLGHAALTRNFELQDEIEVRDDLDKNPDGCKDLKAALIERSRNGFDERAFLDFAEILNDLVKTGREISSETFHFRAESNFYSTNPSAIHISFDGRPFLSGPADNRHILERQLGLLSRIVPKASSQKETSFTFDFEATGVEVKTQATYLRSDDFAAHKLFAFLNAGLEFWRCESTNSATRLILKNTAVNHRNNQVFIVTNLPRASIDPLLIATNAK